MDSCSLEGGTSGDDCNQVEVVVVGVHNRCELASRIRLRIGDGDVVVTCGLYDGEIPYVQHLVVVHVYRHILLGVGHGHVVHIAERWKGTSWVVVQVLPGDLGCRIFQVNCCPSYNDEGVLLQL